VFEDGISTFSGMAAFLSSSQCSDLYAPRALIPFSTPSSGLLRRRARRSNRHDTLARLRQELLPPARQLCAERKAKSTITALSLKQTSLATLHFAHFGGAF
jgi:hypothetical protein